MDVKDLKSRAYDIRALTNNARAELQEVNKAIQNELKNKKETQEDNKE